MLSYLFILEVFAIGRVRSPDRERQRDRKQEITPQGRWSCRDPFSSIILSGSWACAHAHVPGVSCFFFFWRDFHCRARALARQTERDIETESEKSPPRGDGHAAISSPPFSSWDLGHARTRARHESKPLGPGLEPR